SSARRARSSSATRSTRSARSSWAAACTTTRTAGTPSPRRRRRSSCLRTTPRRGGRSPRNACRSRSRRTSGAPAGRGSGWGGDKVVSVAGAVAAREVLGAGLLDEIVISQVPIVLGDGIPWFGGTQNGPFRLSDPEVIQADGVTHLRYQVKR